MRCRTCHHRCDIRLAIVENLYDPLKYRRTLSTIESFCLGMTIEQSHGFGVLRLEGSRESRLRSWVAVYDRLAQDAALQ